MKLVMDLEANGLYQEATTIHCAVFKEVGTNKIWRLRKHDSIIKMLEKCTYLIMHNGIDYDVPLIKKLLGYEYKGKILDTLLMSRELFKNRPVPDEMKADYALAGKKLDGPHSLAAWGYRLGRGKVEHEDWSVFSPEMMHRCVEDVEITHLLYEHIVNGEVRGKPVWDREKFPPRSAWLTMDFMKCISRQQKHGWRLDTDRCNKSLAQLEKWVRWIDVVLDPYVPILPLIKEDRLEEDGTTEGFKAPYTKKGDIALRLQKWMEKEGIHWDKEDIGGPFCRVTFRKVNLNSDKETKEWLLALGWQPEEYNFSKTEKDENGNPKRTSPKLSADDAFIGVNGKVGRLICKRVQCRHRWSNINGWVERVREDNRLESRISGFTDTYRVRHANLANVPNGEKFYGRQMRKCFIAEEGKVLVSADASACQDRMIISRARDNGIHDPVFEHMALYGTREDRTKSHYRVLDEVNRIFEEKGIPLIEYGTAKNFGFAYKFGGQPKKLGFMAGEKNEKRAVEIGTIVKGAFDKIFNAQVQLQTHLDKEWADGAKPRTVEYVWKGQRKSKEELYNGTLQTLDGRHVLIRNRKDTLVYGVQSDEAIMMQYATVLANKELEKRFKEGVQWKQVCFYHDEITVECDPDIAEAVKVILEEGISRSSEYFKLSIPQVGEGAIGQNWMEVH
jgi:DNA polymerase-1